ncbi:hypothetical protein PENTCL1PPCAC_26226, partial [Pristionchus entomophagus]
NNGAGLLTVSTLDSLICLMISDGVQKKKSIFLPRFSVEMNMDFSEVLRAEGVTNCFNRESANLSRLAHDILYVQAVEQKAVFKVDEDGTLAAACEWCDVGYLMGVAPKPLVLTFDHPFIYILLRGPD